MAMGKRLRKGGEEYDAYSGARRLYGWGAGQLAWVKRKTHKRERAERRREARSTTE